MAKFDILGCSRKLDSVLYFCWLSLFVFLPRWRMARPIGASAAEAHCFVVALGTAHSRIVAGSLAIRKVEGPFKIPIVPQDRSQLI